MFVDWNIYAQAALTFLAGGNPYSVTWFYNPVWVLPLYIPFALLPNPYGIILYVSLVACALLFAAWKMRASFLAALAFLFAAYSISPFMFVNVDWLVLLALFVPAPLGLLFALAKPQLGIGLAFYILYRAYRTKRFILTVAPLVLLAALSVALYGVPPLQQPFASIGNMSMFPFLIPVGIAGLLFALRKRNRVFTLPASLCLAPYFSGNSLAVALLALAQNTPLMLSACAVLWAWRLTATR